MNESRTHEPIGESLSRLAHDFGRLLRAELNLFKHEATQQIKGLAVAGALAGAALAMGAAFLGAFTAFIILALATTMAAWLAALVVTFVYGIVATALAAFAVAKFRAAEPGDFDRTTRSVKEDVAWIKSGLKSPK